MKKGISIILAVFMLIIPAMPVAAAEVPTDNTKFNAVFTSIDGETVTTQSEGRPKVIVYFKTTCGNCKRTLQSISSSTWINSGEIDVCAIAINWESKDEVAMFRDENNLSSNIKFVAGSDEVASLVFKYSNSFATPLIAIVDANNQLQCITTGEQSGDTIKQYLDELCPSEGTIPDNSDQPGTMPDQSEAKKPEEIPTESSGNTEESTKFRENSASNTACDHEGGFTVISDATTTSDAVRAYQCVKCGIIYQYETVPNSAFVSFLEETSDMILNAEQEEVIINTKLWVSFNVAVFEAIKSRPDVTVTVNYLYEGNPYVLTIPAGTDVDLLMDENGFGGFRYIEKVLNP